MAKILFNTRPFTGIRMQKNLIPSLAAPPSDTLRAKALFGVDTAKGGNAKELSYKRTLLQKNSTKGACLPLTQTEAKG